VLQGCHGIGIQQNKGGKAVGGVIMNKQLHQRLQGIDLDDGEFIRGEEKRLPLFKVILSEP
jgi:hypothetical protein